MEGARPPGVGPILSTNLLCQQSLARVEPPDSEIPAASPRSTAIIGHCDLRSVRVLLNLRPQRLLSALLARNPRADYNLPGSEPTRRVVD